MMLLVARSVLVLAMAAGAVAQGPWFVDGQSGIDAPGRGRNAALPWRTIGYALAQAQPTGSAAADTLLVAGGQAYSAATNGEVFPLVLRPDLTVRRLPTGPAAAPVLRGGNGETIAVLDANQSYPRGAAPLLQELVFEGGAHGLVLGSAGSRSHGPWIENCTFSGQVASCIRIVSSSGQLDDPLVRECRFEASVVGIDAVADATLAQCAPQVQACAFRGITGTAILLREGQYDPLSGQVVAGAVDGCTFDRCGNGIEVQAPIGVFSPATVFVRSSRFADIAGPAVQVVQGAMFGPGWTTVVVERCSLLRCGTGVQLALGPKMRGELAVRNSTLADTGTGIRVVTTSGGYNARPRIDLSDNTVLRCATGIAIVPGEDAVTALSLRRSRVLECGTGLRLEFQGAGVVESSIVARCQLGLRVSVMGTEFQHLTVADNQVGFRIQNVSQIQGVVGLENCCVRNSAFGGNVVDIDPLLLDPGIGLPLVPSLSFFDHCCLQATPAVGQGNLGLTDPLLVRPYYRILPPSPCIDAALPGPAVALTDYEGGARAVAGVLHGVPVADLGADEFVPGGSAHTYGTGGVGAALTMPRMGASGSPRIGATLVVELAEARSPLRGVHAWFALLAVGWRDDPGVLPLDLAPFGLRNSLLWNEFVATCPIALVDPAGAASQPLQFPSSAGLLGLTGTFQWHCQMPWAEVVSSEALRVTIGQ